ncbi:hypothetical protein PMI0979 [Proteus mirabilis HI4320]|uniref:Uncharacterized protein n=1 Tax=Proteus mirabilis (strain HI4320) TaxID=529507 RepID=B4EVK3_PROMH|nr:hypothetical protein PMI0979 [Proteus mirabilis HI4320]
MLLVRISDHSGYYNYFYKQYRLFYNQKIDVTY